MTHPIAPSRLTVLQQSLRGVYFALAATALTATLAGRAEANPLGGTVAAGQATIAQPAAGQMQIRQTSDRAVIDWRSFSIGAGEAVRFQQPSASSSMLNRVTGNDPSTILGSLSANGRVYLVNQNGVFVGRDARVDAAGLVLSTANISNASFMAGRMNFDQAGKPGARIVNEGAITVAQGGLVAMVAPGVENRGVISARLGQVMLAGASTFSLDLYGDGLVNLAIKPSDLAGIVDANGTPLTNYVDHTGKITADGGRVWISAATARGLLDSSVNIAGDITATRLAGQGGSVTLLGGDKLTVSGRVDATGSAQGGSISASAVNVALGSGAVLDASGVTGGGTVWVGGTYQGGAPAPGAAQTASTIDVAPGARVSAEATGARGNGGNIVLWSEDATRFAGHAGARAGAEGGNGGAIEVSAKKSLSFEGSANASAPMGKAGTLLLDPGSLTVAEIGGTGFTASGSDATVAAANINDTLRNGTSVALKADDDITVTAVIDGRPLVGGSAGVAGGALSLDAGRNVAINNFIVLNGGAFSSLSRNGSFTQAADTAVASLDTSGAPGTGAIGITASGNIQTQYLLTQGAVTLASRAGDVTAGQAIGGVFNGAAAPVGSLAVSAGAGRAVDLGAGVSAHGDIGVAGPAGIVRLGQMQTGGSLSVAAGSFAGMGAQLAQGDVTLSAATGNIALGSVESRGGGRIVVTASKGDISVGNGATLLSRGGTVSLDAPGGSLTLDGSVAANDPVSYRTDAAKGGIVLHALNGIQVNELVALNSVVVTSDKGSVVLRQSLGGTDINAPAIGTLDVRAWNDVTLNGLNLAGTATPASVGLSVRAGAGTVADNPAGGKIISNERIGVTTGKLLLGPAVITQDPKFNITLSGGVYARNGDSDITFDAPVVADGTRIAAHWGALLASQGGLNPTSQTAVSPELSARLVDNLLIPVYFTDPILNTASVVNDVAQRLALAGGGMRVVYDRSGGGEGHLTAICPADVAAACGTQATQYWMVPKIIVSNQEVVDARRNGVVSLNGGASLAALSGDATTPSASLKVIVPSSNKPFVSPSGGDELAVSDNGGTGVFYLQGLTGKTQINIDDAGQFNCNGAFCTTHYLAATLTKLNGLREVSYDTGSQAGLFDLTADVYTTDGNTPVKNFNNNNPTGTTTTISSIRYQNGVIDIPPVSAPGGPVSLTVYKGLLSQIGTTNSTGDQLNESAVPDSGTILVTNGFSGFRSTSDPSAFAPLGGSGVSLSSQILGALVPQAASVAIGGAVGGGAGVGSGVSGTGSSGGVSVALAASTSVGADAAVATNYAVAAASALESGIGPQRDRGCQDDQRTVVGRSEGDEADVGMTRGLQGAPRPVFVTSYALGTVADKLQTVDARAIAGLRQAAPCQ
jgi:filamentous hemagglutinin family protein